MSKVLAALADTPVVLLQGARQTGKTTLAREICERDPARRYFTLDDSAVLSAATSNPDGFVDGLPPRVVLDEVQRVPGLFPAIKASVDRERLPGRFLLTGSANVLLAPKLSESLAGRMEMLTLWPLSQDEMAGRPAGFIDALFGSRAPDFAGGTDGPDLVDRILTGGYPEPVDRPPGPRRRAWYSAYVTTILQREVRDLANVEGLGEFPRLLGLLASRAAGLLNASDLSRGLSMPLTTLKRYTALLQATFLIHLLPAWSGNLGLRLTKSPKLHLCDTGLAASLLGVDRERFAAEGSLLGPLAENFVVMELLKQAGWSRAAPGLFHYRTTAGREVDVVLEDAGGRLVGVEVKARTSVGAEDFAGLRSLAEAAGERFIRGVVLYNGRESVPFDKEMIAMPIPAMWREGSAA